MTNREQDTVAGHSITLNLKDAIAVITSDFLTFCNFYDQVTER